MRGVSVRAGENVPSAVAAALVPQRASRHRGGKGEAGVLSAATALLFLTVVCVAAFVGQGESGVQQLMDAGWASG